MPERPIECSDCKCQTKILYTEIDKEACTSTEMCENCPVLKEKLSGKASTPLNQEICCANCQTNLSIVTSASSFGCSRCYEAFDLLITEYLTSEKCLYKSYENLPTCFYLGDKTEEKPQNKFSEALTDLNEALSEALKSENFEKAALLRDQINQIMDGLDGTQLSS